MEKLLWQNFMKGKWVFGSFILGSLAFQQFMVAPTLRDEVFGHDANGGKMLKIITNLTDEEMARLKFVRRLNWHWRGSRRTFLGENTILDQELSDRGIEWKQEPYIEYVKRPPHDKYL
eukprot:CAMPEP_0202963168 /NCGR_PEP_ID=MMETSP1396-20130829/7159_1 /ASSEMBLY_ACC=CAM_ASM_000872 /TAXON_ID= /ORGANISM="Pseudokeronopsis sp., Strain Brazil" /LENGTH=117 /DNA_ID=CAMNT_0049684163 /DNA_START=9 /DNA_END=362 /DNA_ORIENTATION=+